MRNIDQLQDRLTKLGLTADEAIIYLSVLVDAKSPLQISRDTAIARSSVYRLVDELTARGLLHELTTNNDKLVKGADIDALEILVVEQENAAKQKRADFGQLVQLLTAAQADEHKYAVKTYYGEAGIKQMLWNELKATSEILIFSPDTLNKAVGKAFAENYRNEIIQRGIKQRVLENGNLTLPFTDLAAYAHHFNVRYLAADVLPIDTEITIHPDTVYIYTNWATEERLGTQIKNPFLAAFMRQMFEHFWDLAGQTAPDAKV